jgi:predicted metal-dependent phosphotriesterase family hydrolase
VKKCCELQKGGGSMLFNNFLYDFNTPWEDLVYLIRFLCDKGYEKHVLISMDSLWRWVDEKIMTNVEAIHPETKQKTLSYAITDAVPALLKAGFSAKDIHTFW